LLLDELPPDLEPEESLGPLEAPTPSPSYRRNYSTPLLLAGETWNSRFDPFRLAPYTPWEPLLPTEAKFRGSATGFRPICGGKHSDICVDINSVLAEPVLFDRPAPTFRNKPEANNKLKFGKKFKIGSKFPNPDLEENS
jgi:hypothetical protein